MNSFIFIKTNKQKNIIDDIHNLLYVSISQYPSRYNKQSDGTPLPVLLHKACICRIGRTPPQLFALS